MKKHFKILVLFAVFFTVNSFAYSRSVKEGDSGNNEGNLSLHHLSLREARNDSNVNYLPQIIIIKVKAQYRSVCTKNGINLSSLNKVLGSISAVNVKKKFPDHIPPPEARNKYGQTLIDLSLIYEIKYSAPVSIENAINLLYKDESIEYAEPHYIYKLSYVPNDPLMMGNQWYLSAASGPGSGSIQAFAAWGISKGDTNVVVGIVDTGIDIDHPDLVNNIKYNYNDPINGIDDDGDGYTDNFRGWDLLDNDNNPQSVSNDHGVHVSGCASASTDNGIGVAAPGFNCKILPVRAGDGLSISQGYTGIVYAADHGADIINCSWGGPGGGSFAQDIITYATINKGALVVCAAGNGGADIPHFPSGFEFAFSVASTGSNDVKSGFSNYGKTIDVCAPGSGIYSTGDGGIYYFSSGTSMASPVAAGSAALVKSVYPSYTGLQVGELLRVTCDNIDPINSGVYSGKLGKGRINIYRALTENPPSIRMLNNSVTDGNNNIIETNDTIRIVGDFINYLNTSSANLSVKLSTTNVWVQILNDSSVLGQVAMLQTKTNTVDPFTVYIIPGAPENLLVDFKLTYEDGSYTDFEYFSLRVNVTYIDVRENLVSTTITSKGRLGYNDYSGQLQGLGFIYNSIVNDTVVNLLFEMGLMMATSDTQISNAVRIGGTADDDFVSVQNVSEVIPTQISDYDLAGAFNDNNAGASKLDVLVNYNTFAWKIAPNDKYVIVEYTIKNNGAATLDSMYVGLFADWDIMDFLQNRASWDAANNLGYVYSSQVNGLYGGIKLLTSGAPAYWAIDNDSAVAGNPWGIYDAFTDAEKYQSLSSAIGRTDAGIPGTGEDVSHVVGTGPFTLSVGDSVVVAFALIGGDSLQDIQNSAVAADIMYNNPLTIPLPVVTNDQIKIIPNPTDGILKVLFNESVTNGTLVIYNIIGEKVMEFNFRDKNEQIVDISTFNDGVYFVRINTGSGMIFKKVVLLGSSE
ncbi:MAG: S8 family serine peptidase [Cytophagales bacterium]|nr:S8 family serine peptidase [Cytophagales bacterium]